MPPFDLLSPGGPREVSVHILAILVWPLQDNQLRQTCGTDCTWERCKCFPCLLHLSETLEISVGQMWLT
jgi:hypothetical protein